MLDRKEVAAPGDARVSTGHPPLDTMLDGGLVAHRPYLIVGPSGTGKTTLALQFLCEGVRRGERGLIVTLEEPPNEMRINHRNFAPELDKVEVFDAIPDVMRYERTPFKDIASVRATVPFAQVPYDIRRTPELSSVEVTMTGLEQMLRTEIHRRNYSRLVIDSLTALQYFCMKGFDPMGGAQTFLRFLSDLRTTTLLTVESPLEDTETPERMLARGEIRLFRWELDGATVRAIGVEKFRGSAHDVRLHPYRLGARGLDVNLAVTISRDTRQIVEPAVAVVLPALVVPPAPTPLLEPVSGALRDLIALGVDVAPVRREVQEALVALRAGRPDETMGHVVRISTLAISLAESRIDAREDVAEPAAGEADAVRRLAARAEAARVGVPPTRLPSPEILEVQLLKVMEILAAGAVAYVPLAGPASPTLGAPSPPPAAPPAALVRPAPEPAPRTEPEGRSVPGPSPPSPPRVAASAPSRPPALPAAGAPVTHRPAPANPPLRAPAPPPTPSAPSGRKAAPIPEPPPLPTAMRLPTAALRSTLPPPAPYPSPSSPAQRAVAATGSDGISSPPPLPVPPGAPPLPEPAAPATPGELAVEIGGIKRRRRSTATSRKGAPVLPSEAPPTEAAGAPASESPPKTRRRTLRKRRAPTVIGATAETPPAPTGESTARETSVAPTSPPKEGA